MHDTLVEVLKTVLRGAIALAAFVTGLRAARTDPGWLGKHPRLLARSLLAILVLVPVGAVIFLHAIAAPPLVRAGITIAIVAIGIGPPSAFGRSRKFDAESVAAHEDVASYEVGLNVLLLVLAIVYIPAVVAIHGAIFHHSLRLAPLAVAKVVLGRALVPLAIGILVGRVAPRVVAPVGRYASLFVVVALLTVVVVALIATWRSLLGLGGRTWLTCAVIVLGEVLVGHASGGPALETRRVLASFSAMRFPALALLLVHLVPQGKELIPVILAYVLMTLVLVGIHGVLTSRRGHAGSAGQPRGRAVPPVMGLGGSLPGRTGAS